MSLREVRIIGVGSDLPGEPISNEALLDYCNLVDEEDGEGAWTREKCLEWIDKRVGIEYRHSSRNVDPPGPVNQFEPYEHTRTSALAANAIRKAVETAGLQVADLDMVIVATATPDFPIPSTATLVQERLGVAECAAVDIRSACCGALQGVITAIQYLQTGYKRTIAVAGCDIGSVFGNLDKDSATYTRQDFVNAVMIGDGAGALILRGFDKETEQAHGIEILHFGMNSIGPGKKPGMWLPLGGSVYPATQKNLDQGLQFFKHDFKSVLEHGPVLFTRAMEEALNGANKSISDISLFVPHQANAQIPQLATKFGVPMERMFHNFERVGNTANASTLICLDEIATENKLGEGELVLVASAESTKWLYASILLRWSSLKGPSKAVVRQRDWFFRRWYSSFAFYAIARLVQVKAALGF